MPLFERANKQTRDDTRRAPRGRATDDEDESFRDGLRKAAFLNTTRAPTTTARFISSL